MKRYNMTRIMDEKRISMKELSKRTGLHEKTLYRIRIGADTSTVTLGKIAEALECEVKELI